MFDVCLLYSLAGVWFPFSLAVNLLAMAAAYPPGRLLSTAGLGSLDLIMFVIGPPAGLGSLALDRFTFKFDEEFTLVAGLGSLDFSRATPARP